MSSATTSPDRRSPGSTDPVESEAAAGSTGSSSRSRSKRKSSARATKSGKPGNTTEKSGAKTSTPKYDRIEERTLEGMVVVRVGRGFYECQSQSDAKIKYHVDILSLGGLGECDCWDFLSRRRKRWDAVRLPYDIFRCKHLRRVRQHVLDQILAPYIKHETPYHNVTI